MRLQLPKNKSLSTAKRLRIFSVDEQRIKEIAAQTMHSEVAITRMSVNAGLQVLADNIGLRLTGEGSPKKAA